MSSAFRRRLLRVVPGLVWFCAVGAAVAMFSKEHRAGSLAGFAEDRSITIASVKVGRIRGMEAELHQQVEPGDILVYLDDRDSRLRLNTLTTDLERLQKEIDAESTRISLDRSNVETNTEDLSRRLLTDREFAHIRYLAEMATQAGDQARLNGLLVEEGILKQLFAEKNASFREINEINTEVQSFRARVKANEDNLAQMAIAFRNADARWFAHHDRQNVPFDYDAALAPLRVAVDVKEQEILEVIHHIDEHVRRAPIRGQITAVNVGVGDTIAAGEPMLVISPISSRRVLAYLPETVAGAVRVGAKVRVHPIMSLDGRRSLEGRVISLADAIREAPQRFRHLPTLPVWGREVVVGIEGDAELIPGEAVSISWQSN